MSYLSMTNKSKPSRSSTNTNISQPTITQLQEELSALQSAYEAQAKILEYERKKRAILEHYLEEDDDLNRLSIAELETNQHSFATNYTLYYKDIVENQVDLICRFLPDGTVTFANQAFVDFFGLPPQEILGRKYQSLILPEDRANLDAYLLFLNQKHPVGKIEHRVVRQNDKENIRYWLQWHSRALFTADGRIREFQAVGRDVTQQKNKDMVQEIRFNYLRQNFDSQTTQLRKVNTKLAQSQQKQHYTEQERHLYQQAIESSNDIVVILDSEEKIIFVNQAFKNAYQLNSFDSVEGQNFAQFISQEPRAQWRKAYNHALQGRPLHIDMVDGDQTFEFAVSPIKNGGQVTGVVVFARDVTIRKYTEAAFQQSNDELRRMILELGALNRISHLIATEELSNALPDVAARIRNLFDFYSTTIVLYDANKQLFQVLADVRKSQESQHPLTGQYIKLSSIGISEVELNGQRTARVTPKQLASSSLSKFFVQLPNYKEIENFTFVPLLVRQNVIGFIIITTEKSGLKVQADIPSLETIAQHIAVYIDNARLLRQEQEQRQLLEKQNNELDAFTRMVAHDLKAPLHLIVGFSDMLVQFKEQFDESQRDGLARRITAGARRMSKIIDELLLLAQISRAEVLMAPVDMKQVIDQVLEVVAPLRNAHEGAIHIQQEWPELDSYGPWLEEVWTNYLTNAIKYGGRPYRVEIGATKLENGLIRFWVKDNGKGIKQKNISKLFTEFQRLPEAKTQPGTGLGLSIVKRIVEHLGGAVGVHSAVNKGSIFYFDLSPKPVLELAQGGADTT